MFFYYHCCKILFYGLFFTKIYDSSPHFLYMIKKKSKFFFIIIGLYVHWLYIFPLCLLIWLMKRKIFIPIMFVWWFLCVLIPIKDCYWYGRGLWEYFEICGYAFFNYFLVWKGYGGVLGMGKNVSGF